MRIFLMVLFQQYNTEGAKSLNLLFAIRRFFRFAKTLANDNGQKSLETRNIQHCNFVVGPTGLKHLSRDPLTRVRNYNASLKLSKT